MPANQSSNSGYFVTELTVHKAFMFLSILSQLNFMIIMLQGKGYDTGRHVLACFGGAGGQHACAIARNLGMSTVFIHRYSGILSAYGLALADVVHEVQEPCAKEYRGLPPIIKVKSLRLPSSCV